MKLERIDAVRFGALEGRSLEGLGDGLTVVLGPNESGKSTFTALVRGVLFGFGAGNAKAGERQYRSPAGDRAGRLVFADGEGAWAIERAGEKKRGAVTVSALRGPERPDLLADLVGELTEQTYRVVFGFGVDELDDIEHGDDKYLANRLFAAGMGLDVSPLDVREGLAGEAASLFGERARVAVVNDLLSKWRDARDAVRGLEAQAAGYAEEQARASALAAEIEPVRAARDEAESRVGGLERDALKAADLTGDIGEAAGALESVRLEIAGKRREVEACVLNDAVGERAPELGAVLDEASAFRERLERIRQAEAAAEGKRQQVAALGDLPAGAASVESRAKIEEWVARRATLESDARASARAAEQAEARAAELERASGTASGTSRRVAHARVGATLLAVGVLAAAAGAWTRQWIAAAVGAVVAATGAALLLSRPAESGGLAPEAARVRADARANRTVADADSARLAEAIAAWRAWLSQAGLDAYGDDPAAVRELVDRLASRDALVAEAAGLEAQAARERSLAEEWTARLVALARTFLDLPEAVTLEDAVGIAARVRAALESDRDARAKRDRIREALAALATQEEAASARLEALRHALAEIAARHAVEPDGSPERLRAMADAAAGDLAEVRARYEALSDELSALRGKLDSEGRDAAMAIARQKVEGLGARTAEEARRYVSTALAVRLLDRARERFERERQPEVARVAGRVFSEMTGGRYTDVRVPLEGAVSVVTASGELRPTSTLSRGTAEQLYLALRVGFLASLPAGRFLPVLMDDVVVNADGERREGVAAAIAELATERQVVFFTCHDETAAVLAEAVPSRTLITLDRCRP